jgi:hypothetical protein
MATKKKKVEEVKAPPIISKLPISISDSPLVIDLPDGQKLVVGRMVQGSVIEVATWRGTGRPDSRTSRLMLGMSIDGVNQTAEQKAAEEAANATDAPAQRTSSISNPQLARVQELFWAISANPVFKKLFGKPEQKSARAPKPPKAAPAPTSPSGDIDAPVVAPTLAPVAAIATMPAEPVSPFTPTGTSAKRQKSARSLKLFSKKPAKSSKIKDSKRSAPSWVTPTSSSTNTDIDAWLDEISSKAKARVDNKAAKATPSSAKKAAPAKKSVKKSAPVAKKRK